MYIIFDGISLTKIKWEHFNKFEVNVDFWNEHFSFAILKLLFNIKYKIKK